MEEKSTSFDKTSFTHFRVRKIKRQYESICIQHIYIKIEFCNILMQIERLNNRRNNIVWCRKKYV